MIRLWGFLLIVSAGGVFGAKAEAVPGAKAESLNVQLESIQGADVVALRNGLNIREAKAGEILSPGDHILTDDRVQVVLKYSTGAQVLVYHNTDFVPDDSSHSAPTGSLSNGRVRGEVQKGGVLRGQIRFMIRTKTATMGVRGTDFVATFSKLADLAQFNTLEGTVEVAPSESALVSGQSVPLPAGKTVTATPEGISQVRAFEPKEFIKNADQWSGGSEGNGAQGATGTGVGGVPPAPFPTSPALLAMPVSKLPDLLKSDAERKKDALDPNRAASAKQPEISTDDPFRIRWNLFAFTASWVVFNQKTLTDNASIRDSRLQNLMVAWNPVVPLPNLLYLRPYLRGNLATTVALSQVGAFLGLGQIRDLQIFAGTGFLKPFFFESGIGNQKWSFIENQPDGKVMSFATGVIIREDSGLSRLFFQANFGKLESARSNTYIDVNQTQVSLTFNLL